MEQQQPAGADAATSTRTPFRFVRKVAILIAGSVVLLAGIAMLVLPGPGILVVVAGLAILATEFLWARRQLDRVQDKTRKLMRRNGNDTGSTS